MRKRVLSLMLAIVLAMGALSGVCLISANATTTENLLELYRLNPSYSDLYYNSTEPFYTSGETVTLYTADSQDGDGYSAYVTDRRQWGAYYQLVDIITAQGEGATFAGSYWVKAADADETVKLFNSVRIHYGEAYSAENNNKTCYTTWSKYHRSYYIDANGEKVSLSSSKPLVVGNEWVQIYFEFDAIPFIESVTGKSYPLNSVTVYISQNADDYANEGAHDLLYDNWELHRTDGKAPIVPEFSSEDPTRKDNSALRRYKQTAIGVIYYNNWYTTPSEDNEYGYNYWERYNNAVNGNKASLLSNGHNSAQDARCLSPVAYREEAPFWSKLVEGDDVAIPADLQDGKLIAFEFDEDTWQKEMAYAYYAGINYMAYLGSTRDAISGNALRWHIKYEGKLKYTYNGSEFIENEPGQEPVMQMCVMLQESNQDIPLYISIMDEDYYYKIDGSPVMYFFDSGVDTSNIGELVHDQIAYVRKKAALAGINDVYMIQTGTTSTNATSIVNGDATNNGLGNANGVSWYSFNSGTGTSDAAISYQEEQVAYWKDKASGLGALLYKDDLEAAQTLLNKLRTRRSFQGYHNDNLSVMQTIADDATITSTASIVPTFSLGRDQRARMHTTVSWISSSKDSVNGKEVGETLPYAGRYTDDPSPEEITKGLLDVLNFNKKNYDKFKANSVLMFAWNEFTEGGWICPTITLDENGAVKENVHNTEHLEAVKAAIDTYRASEKYTLLTTDVNGTLTNSSGTTVAQGSAAYMLSPEKATVESKTPYSITLTEQEGCQYSIDNVTYQDSNTFTGLTPGQSYTFYVKATANSYEYFEGGNESTVSDPVQTYSTIQKAPTIKSVTASTITVAKEDWEGYEYSLDNVTYQASNVFTGLNPSTSYTVYARVPGTTTALSVSATTKAKTTPGAPGAPVISETATTSVTLVAKDGYEYSLNGTSWQTSNIFEGLAIGSTYTFYQRIAATAETNASSASAGTTVTLIGHQVVITVDTTGEFDISKAQITADGKSVDVTFENDVISFFVERNAKVTLSFDAFGDDMYQPISIRYAGVKGSALGENEYSFIAYGNRSDYVVKYVLVDETKIVKLFYTDDGGNQVVYDNFVVESDLEERLKNYPALYNRTFKQFAIGETVYTNASAVAEAINASQEAAIDVEVIYQENVFATIEGYQVARHENMTVTVDGEEAPQKVEPFTLVAFEADEEKDGQKFAYWADSEGNEVAYSRLYMRYITSDIDIHPVYGQQASKVAITVAVADNDGKLVLIAERSLAGELDILEHGIILAEYETDSLDLDDVGVSAQGKVYLGHRVDNNGSVLNNGTYILTKGDKHSLGGKYSELGTTLSYVAFVRYTDAQGNEQVKYTPVCKTNIKMVEKEPEISFDEID